MGTEQPQPKKVAFITGITGQDGSYLAEFLLDKGYTVYGLVRNVRGRDFINIKHILHRINIEQGHLEYFPDDLLPRMQPDEIYNLAAATFVGKSWDEWDRYHRVNGEAAARLFETARRACPKARIYQASSSEQFGSVPSPQSEETRMVPRSPYGASKLYAHNMARIYRESFGMHISSGICFNHESPRRGEEFVSRKIAQQVAWLSKAQKGTIPLGSLVPKRDWGHAKDYVRAMWMMLQAVVPDDYVIATGESHSVQEFLQLACAYAGLDWKSVYEKDEQFIRPAEIHDLQGDASKIKDSLGWEPEMNFNDLVMDMVMRELELLRDDEPKREAPADVHGAVQSERGSPPVRGGVPGKIGGPEEDGEGTWSHPPHLEPLG